MTLMIDEKSMLNLKNGLQLKEYRVSLDKQMSGSGTNWFFYPMFESQAGESLANERETHKRMAGLSHHGT